MKKINLLLVVTFCSSFLAIGQTKVPFIEDLLAKMTIEEKIGQLNLVTPGGGIATGSVVSSNVEEKIKAAEVGGMFGISGPEKLKIAQDFAVKETRLKIPLFFGSDVIHGYKTTFPIPLGTASSWDMDLIKKMAQIAAQEATADGINWNFSPMVDVARDPRWGRIAEGAGEDPYLGSAIAKAMVHGYQGTDLTAKNTMIATIKHFALYGAAEAGRDYNSVDMSRTKMFNQYLPPYKSGIDAGAASIMTSFNDVDGIPASGNKWLLTDLLRKKWGFKGFVVSDYTSVNEMIAHGLGDLQDVSALSLKAGLDMDMVGEGFLTTLKKSLDESRVTEEEITNACRRILEAKYKLGLFDDPYKYIDAKRPKKEILTKDSRAVAREAAKRSFVLFKNHNNILPLKKTTKIALVGPLANNKNNMLGTWAPTGDPQLSIPVLEGFKSVAPKAKITYAKGANITNDTELAKKVNVFGTRVDIDKRSSDELLQEALDVAKTSDVVVAVVGEASEMSGEAASRTDISIPNSQKRLIQELVKTGKPVVLVLMSGRPLTIEEEFNLPVSILQVWHPGIEAGNAVADVIFGDYNPSGKLTATWPRNVGQIPIYHSTKNTGRPAPSPAFEKFKSNYLDVKNAPLLPFGYGLSYTNFEYSNINLSKKEIVQGEDVTVSVTVKNSGNFDGEEVVQLYLRDVVRSITPPMRQLKGFKKVFLKKGESKTVKLILTADDLKFYNSTLDFVAEAGSFEIFVGTNSTAQLKATLTLK
ncbi:MULTISPECIES: beta-glucosidase BglX [unclassified Cellulophaga]|uniref:beta-glucosidase BglX n=1 Tax=unclassified Cellulophaga TaxID=2634405 RepID=UPI0026E2B781|nr:MULTISPECIES: beta-glucosidase BglX [unclassified Cellulophaga]MDO6491321.1 beta-glucosidase BglX [Cellulophaga sp. 2_MG-2023]MDO6495146.1 beta-glucosidase BglX [Cellulophaga sp. 3_MG-2023]